MDGSQRVYVGSIHLLGEGEAVWPCALAWMVLTGSAGVTPGVVGSACGRCLGFDDYGGGPAGGGEQRWVASYGTGKGWSRVERLVAGMKDVERICYEDVFRELLGVPGAWEEFSMVEGERAGEFSPLGGGFES